MSKAADRRVSLVTGGTARIGRAVAWQLATGGDRVLFVGRDDARGAEVLAALRQAQPAADRPVPERALRTDRRRGLWAASVELVQTYLVDAVAADPTTGAER